MKLISFIAILFLCAACQSVPEIAKSVESIATDDAIVLKIDRDAIKKDTNVHVNIEVLNKVTP